MNALYNQEVAAKDISIPILTPCVIAFFVDRSLNVWP